MADTGLMDLPRSWTQSSIPMLAHNDTLAGKLLLTLWTKALSLHMQVSYMLSAGTWADAD